MTRDPRELKRDIAGFNWFLGLLRNRPHPHRPISSRNKLQSQGGLKNIEKGIENLKICEMDSFKFGIIVLFCFAAICCEDDLPSLPYRTFRCGNGTYIDSELICNGEVDCIQADDHFDEDFGGCVSHGSNCSLGQFECTELDDDEQEQWVCKDATDRCNTFTDCFSSRKNPNVDENNCGDEIEVEDCTLDKEKYLCDDGLRCLRIDNTCDGFCNCFDCSDEKKECAIGDKTSQFSGQDCFKTPNGPFCRSELDSVWKTAKGKLLLYSSGSTIKGINLFTKQSFTLNTKGITDKHTTTYRITAAHHYVFFATFKKASYFKSYSSSISRTSLETNKTQKIITFDVSNGDILTSLAADYVTNNVYYSRKRALIVCTSDGKTCKNLKSFEMDQYLGRGLYSVNLAPRFGLMFWVYLATDDNTNRTVCTLWKASMDGSDEKLLLRYEPISLRCLCGVMWTVDESAERIYWFNCAKEEIQSVNFDGKKMKILPFKLQLLKDRYVQFREHENEWNLKTQMVDGTLFENEVFFIDFPDDESREAKEAIWSWEKNSKTFARRYPISKREYGRHMFDSPTVDTLFVYNPFLHRTKILNPCPASCKKLCLTRPSPFENSLSYTCIRTTSDATIVGGPTPVISIGVVFSVIVVVWL